MPTNKSPVRVVSPVTGVPHRLKRPKGRDGEAASSNAPCAVDPYTPGPDATITATGPLC